MPWRMPAFGWLEPEFAALGAPFHERGRRMDEGIAFWDYLGERLSIPDLPNVPYLPELVRCRRKTA